MSGVRKRKFGVRELEKRLMLDASLGALVSTTVFAENTVNAAPQILDSDVSITGTTTDFNGESLTVSTTGGTEDQLSINNEGSGAGQIGFDGTNVSFGGAHIGTVSSNGTNGSNLTIDFDAGTSQAAVERLIENITYQNNSDDPATNRTLNFSLGALFSENLSVTVVGQNEGPSIDTNTGATLNEGATHVITSAELGVSDPDNPATDVTFTIDLGVNNGRVENSNNAGVAITSFTLDELNSGLIRYIHNGNETITDSFDFTVSDGSISNSDTFDFTITPVDDTPHMDTNTGTTVFQGLETTIGADEVPALFGTEILTQTSTGQFSAFNSLINNTDSQIAILFTTPGTTPSATPGQVIFETGGSGRGIGLYLNSANQLAWHMGTATSSPRMTSGVSLAANTQYAVVMEIDLTNGEVRMNFQAASDFNWFSFGRTAEQTVAWTDGNLAGSNASGLGEVGSGSYGGFNGSTSGVTNFQGTIDSPLYVTNFPTGGTTYVNTKLIATDPDSPDANLLYTITTNVSDGTVYKSGVALGLNDTFTQSDLNSGIITYTHNGASNPTDILGFSISDGNTTLTGQTFTITVDMTNIAPDLPDQTLQVAEDASNGAAVGTLSATDPNVGQTLTYSIQGGSGAGFFTIDATTGAITVLDNSSFDYETTTSYTLDVRVTDNGPGSLFADRTFTIDILDVNENNAPTFPAQGPYNISEDASVNDTVGTVSATDIDGDNITYSIVGGNADSVFKINATTGEIRINNTTNLDFETRTSYTLTIRATDDDVIPLSTDRNITITINDVNEAPSFAVNDVIYAIDQTILYSSATGNFYKYVGTTGNFASALNNADNVALNGAYGHLVTITSAAENTFIDNMIANHIWIAASDSDVEGQWLWVAGPEAGQQFSQGGTPVNGMYERWNGSEPNSGNAYDYAYMNTNGQWYDQTGNESRAYVIEWEGADVINNDTYTLSHTNPDASDITNGTSVGFVQAADEDGNAISYSITGGNADGIFEVDATTGEVRILDTTNLDATIQDTYVLTVRATETDGTGLYGEVNITINFDNSASLTTNNPLSVNESGSSLITTAVLDVTDADTPATDIIFTVSTQPAEGQLELISAPGARINSFTLDDIQNNRVVYVHSGSETIADTFQFSVTDGASTSSTGTFSIDVVPQNDAPTVSVNTGTTILEGGARTITNAMLNSVDADDIPADRTYTASSLLNGTIEVSGVSQNTFTQADINAGIVRFIHDGSEANGRFDFVLADGGEDGAGTASGTFTLTRTPVNDSPTISINTGATVLEGGTVAIDSTNLASIDIDDSDPTLVYTLSVIVNGQVELSTNPGVPIISFTQDDLNNGRVIFRHDGSENLGRFDFSVADGGEDGAAPATGSFAYSVIPVNDSPIISAANNTTVDTGGIVLVKKAVLNSFDPDDSGTGLTYTIDSVSNGQLELLGNPGVAITSFTQADINNSQLVFRHDGTATLTAQFQVTLADGGEDGAVTDSATIDFVVNNTNDSPTISLNTGATMDEGATLTITNSMLDSFDPDDTGTGLTWSVSNVSANGRVELSTNPGVTITSFTQANLDNGLVRFVHDGGESVSASFDLVLADGGEDGATTASTTFNITVAPVNDSPTLVTVGSATVAEGSNVVLTSAMLNATDIDDAASGLTYTASNITNGHIEVSGVTQNTFTQADINAGIVRFVHDGSETAAASFDISLADGGEDGASASSGTFALSVTPTNDSPLIGTNTGGTISEGGVLTLTNAMLNEADPDDSGAGLTYSASNLTNGVLKVSGVIQNNFTQSDIDAGRVTFTHDGSETAAASFDISLADGGEDGATAASDTFTMNVTPVNDAPSLATNIGVTLNEGGQAILTNAMLAATDVDNADSGLIYTLVSLSGGSLENTNTSSILNLGDSFTQSDIDNGYVRYTHNGQESLSETMRFHVSDGALTTSTQTFHMVISPVNDVPTDIQMDNFVAYTDSAIGATISSLRTLDADRPSDSFTYTLIDDAGGTFTLSGNRLVLAQTLDIDMATSHTITVQTDDGHGGTFTRNLTITVSERPTDGFFIAPRELDRPTAELSQFEGHKIEEIFSVADILNPEGKFGVKGLIQSALGGLDSFAQTFYGTPQKDFGNHPVTLEKTGVSSHQTHEYQSHNLKTDDSNTDSYTPQFTNLRDMLSQLDAVTAHNNADQAEGEQNGEDKSREFLSALEQEFEDVLTYHEMKKAKLREALLKS